MNVWKPVRSEMSRLLRNRLIAGCLALGILAAAALVSLVIAWANAEVREGLPGNDRERSTFYYFRRWDRKPLRKVTIYDTCYYVAALDAERELHGLERAFRTDNHGLLDEVWHWHGESIGYREIGERRFLEYKAMPAEKARFAAKHLFDEARLPGHDWDADYWRIMGPELSDAERAARGYAGWPEDDR